MDFIVQNRYVVLSQAKTMENVNIFTYIAAFKLYSDILWFDRIWRECSANTNRMVMTLKEHFILNICTRDIILHRYKYNLFSQIISKLQKLKIPLISKR